MKLRPSPLTRAALTAGACTAGALLVAATLGWLALGPEARAAIGADARAPLLVLLLLAAAAVAAIGAWRLLRPHIGMVARVVHALDILREANASFRLTREAPPELARAVNALAADYQYRIGTVESRIREATDELATERDLLAALLAQLREAVLVCADDGRILLYNPPARALLSGEQAAFVGLGRSIFSLFRRSVILHCLDRLSDLREADNEPAVRAVISTRDGRLLRARFSPLREGRLSGFFLTLTAADSVASGALQPEEERAKVTDAALRRLTHVRTAIEALRDYPDMEEEQRERFLAMIDDESAVLGNCLARGRQLDQSAQQARWPLEEIAAETFCTMLQRRVADAAGATVALRLERPEDWLRADSYAMAAALRFVTTQVGRELDGGAFSLRLTRSDGHAAIDLLWAGAPVPPSLWSRWEHQPVQEGDGALPYTLSEIAQRHGGECWPLGGDTPGARWLLPLAEPPGQHTDSTAVIGARPEFYDFNLFASASPEDDRGDRRLRELICTAFDTETTGLDPAGGDQIIAIGGIRVVNGRILSQEVFESFVGTSHPIASSAQEVHGISAAMLADAPPAEQVLPRFADFCEDTVLLAHNGAFDLSFLSRQGSALGTSFTQPVLDTLLLSAVLYPEGDGHQLEAIAERVGVSVIGRHTALGDAIVTAEVFVRLIPLLEARGIETLGDALRASQETWYARLDYG
ncbi:3'-5' exonuclease [Algiphilus aromaticivorans]|uniref:3'-5' exonuclease n=1 Tax=Algiphilus aromaticivorans TaxID=382454 RepID=UPI000693F28C|nr:exonuclease domain-containing protein [Algiphilus aromaticivorans]